MHSKLVALGLGSLVGVAACAAAPAPSAPSAGAPDGMLVLIKLVRPEADGTAIARQASEVAALPVRYVSAASMYWHALALGCASASACDIALQRLRADSGTYAAVQRDERKRIVTP